jgi:hypothetical protein
MEDSHPDHAAIDNPTAAESLRDRQEHQTPGQKRKRTTVNENWAFYLGDSLANTFYHASELVMTRAAIDLVEAQNPKVVGNGFDNLCRLSTTVAHHVTTLFGEIMAEIIDQELPDQEADPIEIDAPEKFFTFFLPISSTKMI